MDNAVLTRSETVPPAIVVNAVPKPSKVVMNWNFTVPESPYKLYTLLTIMGVAVTALWNGDLGEHYVAWAAPSEAPSCGQMH